MIKKLLDKIISTDPEKVRSSQYKMLALVILAVIGILFTITKVVPMITSKGAANHQPTDGSVKIKLGSDMTDGDKVWGSYFEAKLLEEKKAREEEKQQLLLEFQKIAESLQARQLEESERLESQIQMTELNLRDAMNKNPQNSNEENDLMLLDKNSEFALKDLASNADLPKDIGLYIPASTYVAGRLLSGISVSTGVGSQSDPVPLIVRLTDYANLPGNHKSDLKDCRVLASCHGDLSSERVMIRLETLVCFDEELKRSVETKVAGFIVGQDGVNGIRGNVVSMDVKHLKNAALGGFLSGLSATAKTEGSFALNPAAGVIKEKDGLGERLKNNSLSGVGSATEKLASYYIQRAESISPVIEVPAGSLVDVVFTEGVYIGQQDTKVQIDAARK
jgi:hypothetical protein